MKRVVVALALCAGACRVGPPEVTQGDAVRVHADLAALQQGRTLLVAKCGNACHPTPLPSAHRAPEWPRMLDEMSLRAGLDGGQRALIQQYLIAMAPR